MTLEEELETSLHARAEQFEPTDGSYLALQRRLAEAQTAKRRDGRTGLGPRLLAAAASIAVLGGIAAFALGQNDGGVVQVLPGETAPLESDDSDVAASAAVTDDPSESTDESAATEIDPGGTSVTEATPSVLGPVDAAPAGVLGPPRSTWQEAALSFLDLIQVPSEAALLAASGDTVAVSALSEAGQERPVTVLTIGSRDLSNGEPGYVVVRADSARATITSPAALDRITENRLVVEGRGEGFEGTVDLSVYSAGDGVALVKTFTQAGNFGQVADYDKPIMVFGTENAWIVATSSSGADLGIAEFSAIPVTIAAPRPSVTYTVTNIAANDADGGLVARATPLGERKTVIPAATTGLQVRGVPYLDGSQRWVNVWLPAAQAAEAGRLNAWVNSAFLVLEQEISKAELEAIAAEFVGAVETGGVGFDQLPWAERKSVAIGWGGADPVRFSSADLGSTGLWDEIRTWAVPEDLGEPTIEESLRSFVGLADPVLDGSEFAVSFVTETGNDPRAASPYGRVQNQLAPRFAGTQWIKISDATSDGSEWKTTTLFVESGPSGDPEIVGVIVDFWVP